jgi:hypothetical protein
MFQKSAAREPTTAMLVCRSALRDWKSCERAESNKSSIAQRAPARPTYTEVNAACNQAVFDYCGFGTFDLAAIDSAIRRFLGSCCHRAASQLTSGLRATEMNGKLLVKRMQSVASLREGKDVIGLALDLCEITMRGNAAQVNGSALKSDL